MKSRDGFHLYKLFFLSACVMILPAVFQNTELKAQVAETPSLLVATGPGIGYTPEVKLIRKTDQGVTTFDFRAYANSYRGGVRVAVGDVNGDGVADIITGPGPGCGSHIRVFDGRDRGGRGGLLKSFFAYSRFFRGGVFVAAGDINGDGKADIVVGPDSGHPSLVRVFDGETGNVMRSFFAYSPLFLGGVRVAVGDVNGDGKADIITGAGPGGGPHVKVFDGATGNLLQSFFAFNSNFLGGVYVSAGEVDGDGRADVITGAGAGAAPQVKVFSGNGGNLLRSFFAYDASFLGGVRVAAGDVNGDGLADIITGAGPGGGPHIKIFNSASLNLLYSFFAYEPNYTGGVFVAGVASRPQQR
jgi:FG-GAP-like repeat/FG-GAP repeat